MTNLETIQARLARTKDFSHRAHDSISQVRKYTGESYWVHTDAVADKVFNTIFPFGLETGIQDYALEVLEVKISTIEGSYLHDYREDVVTKLQEQNRLEELAAFEAEYEQFSELTRKIVIELTDVYTREAYPQFNRAKRKFLENERLSKVSPEAQTVKLADLIDNSISIVGYDRNFARTYLQEKLTLLGELVRGNSQLLQEATAQTIRNYREIGLMIPMISA